MKNKKTGLIIAAVVAVILIAGVAAGFIIHHNQQVYHQTYIVIDEAEYLRASTELDLSGSPVGELDKLKELTALQKLDLRDTGITLEQYEDLSAALPGCQILWSVPFQGGYFDNTTTTSLTLTSLTEADIAMLEYLPALTGISAEGCGDYAELAQLMEAYPDLQVSYTVSIGGTEYPHTQEALELADPDVDALMENLQYLPMVRSVVLDGTLPEKEVLLQLKEIYPDVVFDYDLQVFGETVNSLTEFIDLSGKDIDSIEEVEAILPYFYNLTQVDMVGCGISNENMAALNNRNAGTKFVWKVNVSGVSVRTDIKYFMPWQYNIDILGNCYNLRYCTDVVCVDIGHFALQDFSFVEHMPNLEYLLLCQDPITDISVISNCTNLRVLEIFLTNVSDFWPLTNLTNLEDLNISYTPAAKYGEYGTFGDITPLYQMTWLDRLWMANSRLSDAKEQSLREALPNTTLLFHSKGSTNFGWRQSPNYYVMRDLLGLWYMIH